MTEMDTAIKQIISAITADNVIDIFDAGLKKPNIEILDERFFAGTKDLEWRPGLRLFTALSGAAVY